MIAKHGVAPYGTTIELITDFITKIEWNLLNHELLGLNFNTNQIASTLIKDSLNIHLQTLIDANKFKIKTRINAGNNNRAPSGIAVNPAHVLDGDISSAGGHLFGDVTVAAGGVGAYRIALFNDIYENLSQSGNLSNRTVAKSQALLRGLVPKFVTPYLHWLDPESKSESDPLKKIVKKVYVGNHKYMLKYLGKMRFDTVLVRNLMWLANLQRLLRLKLRRDLAWYDSKVVSQHAVTASSITELYGNDMRDRNMYSAAAY
jgi:hypothetical protein